MIEVTLSLSEGVVQALNRLVATSGLYGETIEDAAAFLVQHAVIQAYGTPLLPAVILAEEATGPRCPACGSPKINLMPPAGGSRTAQCMDCNRQWEYENSE